MISDSALQVFQGPDGFLKKSTIKVQVRVGEEVWRFFTEVKVGSNIKCRLTPVKPALKYCI